MLRLDLFRIISHVSEKVLASTLNYLEGEGLVERTSYESMPPCVEYSLTRALLKDVFGCISLVNSC